MKKKLFIFSRTLHKNNEKAESVLKIKHLFNMKPPMHSSMAIHVGQAYKEKYLSRNGWVFLEGKAHYTAIGATMRKNDKRLFLNDEQICGRSLVHSENAYAKLLKLYDNKLFKMIV